MDLNKLKEIQAVVFDMDGLMFDSERYVQKSWDIAGERLGYGPLGHNIVNTLGTNLTNRKKYFLRFVRFVPNVLTILCPSGPYPRRSPAISHDFCT